MLRKNEPLDFELNNLTPTTLHRYKNILQISGRPGLHYAYETICGQSKSNNFPSTRPNHDILTVQCESRDFLSSHTDHNISRVQETNYYSFSINNEVQMETCLLRVLTNSSSFSIKCIRRVLKEFHGPSPF